MAEINLQGTGALAAYSETLTIPLFTEVVASRDPGEAIASFGTDMKQVTGSLPFGASSTFCFLQIDGGSDLVGPSAGQVDLTDIGGGQFEVDSFFDVSYQITYQGCPGSLLDGISGTSDVGVVTMTAHGGNLAPALGVFGTVLVALGIARALVIHKRRS